MIQYIICLAALIIGSITDLKTREVPDYLNYFLIITGISIAVLTSIIYKDSAYILASLIGFALCFALSCIMYYTGQWGGGDAKMLMGLGALMGLSYNELVSLHISLELPVLMTFLILIFFIGGIYGSVWMAVVLMQHWKEFKKRYSETKHNSTLKYTMYSTVIFSLSASFIIDGFYLRVLCVALASMIFILYYLFIILKILEQIAFIKDQPIDKITEGDWVAEDIIINEKTIARKKDLGITKEQLAELTALEKKGKIKTVKIKYGIPFVPSFLIAFIVTIIITYS